jgi:hypothetical protein
VQWHSMPLWQSLSTLVERSQLPSFEFRVWKSVARLIVCRT